MNNRSEYLCTNCQSKSTSIYTASINSGGDHIQHMKPSAELVTYYQKKVEDLNESLNELEKQLEMCKSVAETNWFAQEELTKRNDEVVKLTSSISDLQVFIYQEREHVLQLSAENDRLRLIQVEYKKKLDILLSFAGLPKDFISFVCTDQKQNKFVPRKGLPSNVVKRNKLKVGKKKLLHEIADDDVQIEKLHVQALMAEWDEQSQLYRDEIHSLLTDRQLRQKEWTVEQERLQKQITNLNNMLKSIQSNVCDDSERLIKMEKRHRSRENVWMEEKTKMLKNLELAHEAYHKVPYTSQVLKSELAKIKKQILEKDKITSMYKDQNRTLENELERLQEQMELQRGDSEEKLVKLKSQVLHFKKKCNEEKRRRLLESEGFYNDIKFLRDKVQTLEKKVLSTASV